MKAALIDEQNNFIDLVSADLQVLHPFDGASEVDMEKIWDVLCSMLNQLADRNPLYWNEVAGIGITGQGDGAWLVDSKGDPVCNAILWNDTRTKSTVIDQKDDLDQYCQDNSITPVFHGANYYILKWVEENNPEQYNRISKVLHCKDWLNFKLTGSFATDYSDTSTAMLNSLSMSYDFKVLEFLGLKGAEDLFAPIHYSDEITGKVSSSAAAQTRLKAGIPVVTGSIDIAGVAAGADANEPGDTVMVIGTTCCVTMVLQRSQLDYCDRRGSILCHQSRDRYLRLIAMSNGTACLDWVRQTFLPSMQLSEIEKSIRSIEIGSKGVLFQPYLYGERAPFRNAHACGSFLGITAHHTPFHLIRASYEGLVFALSQCYLVLPKSDAPIHLAGGGATNNTICQMVSDYLGKELIRSHTAELGLKGITKTIRKGLGISEFEQIQQVKDDRFFPNQNNHKLYEELSILYSSAFHAMEPWWEARNSYIELKNQ